MRLVDADACPALFDAEFKKTRRLIIDGEKHLDNLAEGFMEAHNVIRSMQTIDATPVVYGRWLKNERFKQKKRKCSECGFDSDFEFNFCPNCGARMG